MAIPRPRAYFFLDVDVDVDVWHNIKDDAEEDGDG
jgi:hypothetical protein